MHLCCEPGSVQSENRRSRNSSSSSGRGGGGLILFSCAYGQSRNKAHSERTFLHRQQPQPLRLHHATAVPPLDHPPTNTPAQPGPSLASPGGPIRPTQTRAQAQAQTQTQAQAQARAQAQTRRVWSHEPVQTAWPLGLTPTLETRLSCMGVMLNAGLLVLPSTSQPKKL